MSVPVEGKPGIRLVDYCTFHDSAAADDDATHCETWAFHVLMSTMMIAGPGPNYDTPPPCRMHRFELRQHGYERNIEWGEQ